MATYADLIAKRSPARRTVTKPLCLDMTLWDAYLAAKAAHQDAEREQAKRKDADTPTRRRHADAPVTTATAQALADAADAMNAMSLWLTFRIPSALEQDKLITDLEATKGDDGESLAKGSTPWLIGYLAACFDHASTIDGDRLDDFTVTSLTNELSTQSMGIILDMHQAVAAGIVTTDFPTRPKR